MLSTVIGEGPRRALSGSVTMRRTSYTKQRIENFCTLSVFKRRANLLSANMSRAHKATANDSAPLYTTIIIVVAHGTGYVKIISPVCTSSTESPSHLALVWISEGTFAPFSAKIQLHQLHNF